MPNAAERPDMDYELFESKLDVIEGIKRGVESVDALNDATLGPTTYEQTDYPYPEILPSSTNFEGGNEFSHTVDLGVIFERTERQDDYLVMMGHVFEAIKATITELEAVECVGLIVPQSIEDFAAELSGTLLVAFRVELFVTVSVDLTTI